MDVFVSSCCVTDYPQLAYLRVSVGQVWAQISWLLWLKVALKAASRSWPGLQLPRGWTLKGSASIPLRGYCLEACVPGHVGLSTGQLTAWQLAFLRASQGEGRGERGRWKLQLLHNLIGEVTSHGCVVLCASEGSL